MIFTPEISARQKTESMQFCLTFERIEVESME